MSEIFYKNKFSISIKKCCASCKFKQMDVRVRFCTIGEGIVSPQSVCGSWQMNPDLDNAGKGGGRIKKKKYLNICLDRLDEDNYLAIEHKRKKMPHKRLTLQQIRSDYEKKYGDIYFEKE